MREIHTATLTLANGKTIVDPYPLETDLQVLSFKSALVASLAQLELQNRQTAAA